MSNTKKLLHVVIALRLEELGLNCAEVVAIHSGPVLFEGAVAHVVETTIVYLDGFDNQQIIVFSNPIEEIFEDGFTIVTG